MTIDSVRRVIGSESGEVGRRVDVARKARSLQDRGLDAGRAGELDMAARARLAGGEGERELCWWLQQQGVGAAVLGLSDDDGALPAGLEQGGNVVGSEIG